MIKVALSSSNKVGFICFNESPLKNNKAFLFYLQNSCRRFYILLLQKILRFCPNFFGCVGTA